MIKIGADASLPSSFPFPTSVVPPCGSRKITSKNHLALTFFPPSSTCQLKVLWTLLVKMEMSAGRLRNFPPSLSPLSHSCHSIDLFPEVNKGRGLSNFPSSFLPFPSCRLSSPTFQKNRVGETFLLASPSSPPRLSLPFLSRLIAVGHNPDILPPPPHPILNTAQAFDVFPFFSFLSPSFPYFPPSSSPITDRCPSGSLMG